MSVGSVLFWCFRYQLEQLYPCRNGVSYCMLLDMMLDKICDFLIGVFFFLVISRCRAVVGQVLMIVKLSAFSFDFM